MADGHWIQAKRDGRCTQCKKPFLASEEIYLKGAGVIYCHVCGLLSTSMPASVGPMEASVLKELAKLPLEAADGTLAQSMMFLARQLDAGDVAPREVSQYTKELRISLLSLQDAYPATDEEDETEEARRKRERRAREAGGY